MTSISHFLHLLFKRRHCISGCSDGVPEVTELSQGVEGRETWNPINFSLPDTECVTLKIGTKARSSAAWCYLTVWPVCCSCSVHTCPGIRPDVHVRDPMIKNSYGLIRKSSNWRGEVALRREWILSGSNEGTRWWAVRSRGCCDLDLFNPNTSAWRTPISPKRGWDRKLGSQNSFQSYDLPQTTFPNGLDFPICETALGNASHLQGRMQHTRTPLSFTSVWRPLTWLSKGKNSPRVTQFMPFYWRILS